MLADRPETDKAKIGGTADEVSTAAPGKLNAGTREKLKDSGYLKKPPVLISSISFAFVLALYKTVIRRLR